MCLEVACRTPYCEVGEDSAALEGAVPVECVGVNRVRADLAIGGDEAVGDAAGCGVDEWLDRSRGVQWRIGEEQVSEGEVVGGVGDLARGPVEHHAPLAVGEHIEWVKIAVAHNSQLRTRASRRESFEGLLRGRVGEFVGACNVVVEETVNAGRSVRHTTERGVDRFGIESVEVGGGSGESVGEHGGEAGE